MIKTVSLTKTFGSITALENLSTTIESGSIYGLVGSNGAGKSTLLHLLAGIYRPTSGSIEIDGQPVYENPACKQQIFFIPDEIYQQPGASMESMAKLYACLYTQWSQQRYEQLVQRFPIDPKRKLSTCSKGMRRQIAIILGMSCMPKYLLLDEAFDGLDPVIRVAVRKLISDDVIERGTTVLIASHNLRELEDLCDQVGLLQADTSCSSGSWTSCAATLPKSSLPPVRCPPANSLLNCSPSSPCTAAAALQRWWSAAIRYRFSRSCRSFTRCCVKRCR